MDKGTDTGSGLDLDLPEVHARSLLHTGAIVAATTPDDLGRPTPCEGWDVAALLHHLVTGNCWVTPLVEGSSIEEVGDRFDGDVLGDDHVAAYNRSAHDAAVAFQADGALEAMVKVSYGPVPGHVYCGHRTIDALVHGWDLAVATEQPTELPAALVEACWAIAEPQLEMISASGEYGTTRSLGPDASAQDRLLAALGRTG